MTRKPHILIGCEAFVRQGNNILLGKRAAPVFGAGTWALPGGHPEGDETMAETLCRELREEMHAEVKPSELRLATVTDGLDGRHYVHISFEFQVSAGFDISYALPEECDEWRWFPIKALPEPFFEPHRRIVDTYLSGQPYLL